jgi:hypothetical protein
LDSSGFLALPLFKNRQDQDSHRRLWSCTIVLLTGWQVAQTPDSRVQPVNARPFYHSWYGLSDSRVAQPIVDDL